MISIPMVNYLRQKHWHHLGTYKNLKNTHTTAPPHTLAHTQLQPPTPPPQPIPYHTPQTTLINLIAHKILLLGLGLDPSTPYNPLSLPEEATAMPIKGWASSFYIGNNQLERYAISPWRQLLNR